MKIVLKCRVPLKSLLDSARAFPQLLDEPPIVEFDCDDISCTSTDELIEYMRVVLKQAAP